jgi:hypothetical protein
MIRGTKWIVMVADFLHNIMNIKCKVIFNANIVKIFFSMLQYTLLKNDIENINKF